VRHYSLHEFSEEALWHQAATTQDATARGGPCVASLYFTSEAQLGTSSYAKPQNLLLSYNEFPKITQYVVSRRHATRTQNEVAFACS
jgi:hypothetical protein